MTPPRTSLRPRAPRRRRGVQDVTIADVARRAGVSGMTVSRALSGTAPVNAATEERVRQAVRALGYRPNAAALAYGILGSIDINRGDPRNGWDTDQFPNNAQELTPAMLHLLASGGFTTGGINFDAKIRRQSVDPIDLYLAHIGGLDTLARALLAAARIIEQRRLASIVEQRYAGWSGPLGQKILGGAHTLASLADHAVQADLAPCLLYTSPSPRD